MNKTNYKVVGAALAMCLVALSVGIAFGAQIATTNYYLDTPLPLHDFYVGQYTNSSYFAINGSSWDNFLVSTNASYVINICLGNLSGTATESVYLKGSFSLTNSIIVQKNWTWLLIDGTLTAANGLDQAIIRIPETSVLYGVTIEGVGVSAMLAGNSAGQANDLASGINLTRTTGSLPSGVSPIPSILVKNLYIKDTYSAGVYCNFGGTGDGGELGFQDVTVQSSSWLAGDITGFGGGSVVFLSIFDSYWRGGLISGSNVAANYAFLGLVLSGIEFHPYYMNGYSKIYTGNRVDWSCQYMDNSGDADTLALYNVNTSRVHDSTFNIMTGMDNNTYSGITMGPDPDCFNNVFSDLVFSSYGATLMFEYGVEEKDSGSDYNVFTGITGGQYGTGAVMLQGSHSEADADDIIGTIV